MGDMVCTTPLFRCAKQNMKGGRLFVMGDALNKELLAGNPHIDEYLVLPKTRSEITKLVREKKIDFAALTTTTPQILLALLLAGVRCIVVPRVVGGFSPYNTKTYRLLSLLVTRIPISFGEYMPRAYLRLLEPLGIESSDTRKELYFTPEALARAEALLPREAKLLIGIAPGVGNKIKVWGAKKFAAVARTLHEKYGATIVLIGGSRDREEVEMFRQALSHDVPLIDGAEKLTVDELKALISRLQLFIAVDTGPIYIAEAFGVPTVDIVGPMDEREQPPRGALHRVVVPLHRTAPALHIMNAAMFGREEAHRQTEAITPEMVLSEIDEVMKALQK